MMPADRFDRVLDSWITYKAPAAAPPQLHARAMDVVRHRRQRVNWSATIRGAVGVGPAGGVRFGTAWRVAALVALTLILGVFLVFVGGTKPPVDITPSPTPPASPTPVAPPTVPPLQTTEFSRPFSYVLPVDNSIRTAPPTEQLFQFIDGSFAGRHGMVVAAIARASVARCPGALGAVPIRNAPAALLEDLEAIGGFTLPSPTQGTVDGRVATVTRRNEDSSPCAGEFHIETGLASDAISMTRPGSMILFDVDGETVLIDVWAINEAELESWLPTAMELVDTIQFVPPPIEPTAEFARPFPTSCRLTTASARSHQARISFNSSTDPSAVDTASLSPRLMRPLYTRVPAIRAASPFVQHHPPTCWRIWEP